MNRIKILFILIWLISGLGAVGQMPVSHSHKPGENCLKCRATEVNEKALREEAEYLANRKMSKKTAQMMKKMRVMPPAEDFEYVIPIVFHVFGTEFNGGTTVTLDLIRKALIETNRDFHGLQDDWQKLHPARDSIKKALNITFRLAEKDPDGNPTTGVTFHDWNAGFGHDSKKDSEIQKYAWDNYHYMNVYIMQDLYGDKMTNNSGVAWYPSIKMSDESLARVVYNGSYLGTNTDTEFRSVLTHEFGHFFNLKHTFEGCETSYTYPNDEIDDTPVHRYDLTLQEGAKNPFGEVIDVCNFMNYPRQYKNYTRLQVKRMKEALMHEARVTLWQPENHKKVFYMEPTPRLEVAEGFVQEGVKNDGSFTDNFRLTVLDADFKTAVGEYLPEADYEVKKLPQGLSVKVKVLDTKNLAVELAGNAVAHDIANNTSFSVILKNSILNEGTLLNSEAKLNITFRAPYEIVYVDADDINVNPSSNWNFFFLGAGNAEYGAWYSNNNDMIDQYKLQSYRKPLVATPGTQNIIPLKLGDEIGSNSEWVTPKDEYLSVLNLKTPEYLDWVGKNAYVGVQFQVSGEVVYGWINITFNADGKGYTVHDWAYNTNPGASIKAGETKDGIKEKIQLSPGELTEGVANDGSFTDKVAVKILGVNSEFTKTGVLQTGTDYTISGMPDGISLKISLTDKLNGEIALEGKAVKHDLADSCDIKIVWNKALVNNENIAGLSSDIRLWFKAPYGIVYKDIADIWIAPIYGPWSEFGFGVGNAEYEVWYAEKLGGKFKFVSAYNPLVAYKGTSKIVPLKFGEMIGEALTEGMAWEQQKTDVPQAEIDESMLDLKTDDYLEWVGQSAYVGVQFKQNGLVHYGWVGIKFDAGGAKFTIEDWAYNEEPGKPIPAGHTKPDQAPFLVWSGNMLKELTSNEGKMDSAYIKVKGTKFAIAKNEKLVAGTHYSADALPDGLSLEIVMEDEMTAKMLIKGQAVRHTLADSLIGWKVALKNEAFVSPVNDREHKFDLRFRNPYKVVYVNVDDMVCSPEVTWDSLRIDGQFFGLWLNEGALRLETEEKGVICKNSGNPALIRPLPKGFLIGNEGIWNAGGGYPDEHWVWSPDFHDWEGREAYIGVRYYKEEDYQFAWLRIYVAKDGTSYKLLDYAYCDGPGMPLYAGDKGVTEPAYFMTDNKVFNENWDNQGVISDTLYLDLVYGGMVKTNGVLGGDDYSVTGLSEGLQLKLEPLSERRIRATVQGMAKQHAAAESVENLEITFNNSLFTSSTVIKTNKMNLTIAYKDPYKVIYEDFADIECSRYNTWALLDIDGNSYGIWYDIEGGLLLRLETYGAPLVCVGDTRNIVPMKRGEMIGAHSNWVDGAGFPDEHNICTPSFSDWRGKEAYIGLKYEVDEGRTRYGWIRIEVSADGQSYIAKDFAYNQVFNESIMAGSEISEDLMVSFSPDRELVYEKQQVKFTNITFSSKEVTAYHWTFEGGKPAVYEGKDPGMITYNTSGKYSVSLKVETADTTITCLKEAYINVEPVMLKADFTASGLSVVEGNSVLFTDASAGSFDIVKWEWSFEGGQPSVSDRKNPGEVVYATAGEYEVTLKVTDSEGRMHTKFATPGISVYKADYKQYCPVTVDCPTENTYCYIKGVSVGEISNATEFDGYSDYSRNIQFSVTKGETIPLKIDLNRSQEAAVSAWIDWNGDGIFDETEEVVAGYIDNFDKPEKLMIRVPENAVTGVTGMRVRVKIGDRIQPPCVDEGYYGEVEDYSVVVGTSVISGDIMADKQNIRSGESIQFKADINQITDAGVESYQWTFEGASNTTSVKRIPDPVEYQNEGTFNVTLELTLQGGEKKTVVKDNFIVVNPAVTIAGFTASAMDIPAGGKVSFKDASESAAGIAAWEWSFEGGSPASYNGETPPEITYANEGSFEVILTVTDKNGKKSTKIEPLMIEVYENTNTYCQIAEAGSYYSIVKVALGEQKHETAHTPEKWVNDFTDFAFVLSKGSALPFVVELSMDGQPAKVMAWIDWNQDGVYDEATETIARYQDDAKPGEITVTVPADAKEGATGMRVRTSYYNYRTPCDVMESMGELEDYSIIVKRARQEGYIVADNTNPAINAPVHFTAFVNRMTDENITGYRWTFAGGIPATSTERKPAAVSYAVDGVYDVMLELTLESGKKKSITMYDFITVGEKAPEVKVNFTATPLEIFAGSSVGFNASATGNGSVTGYAWTFEGATPDVATTEMPTVSYAVSGEYDVTLVATLNDGSQRTVKKSNYITVNPFLLKADFTASAIKVNSGKDIVFTNASAGADTYSWDFGDGTALITTEDATHAFAAAGTYTVTLTVTGNGETQSKSSVITVSAMKSACESEAGYWQEGVYLKLVKVGSAVNDVKRTGTVPYFDFTGNEAFAMTPGENVAYELQFANSWGPLNATAWVDWDDSGDFSDTEIIANGSLNGSAAITGTVSVPADLSDRLVRMRIVTGYSGEGVTMSPCGDGGYSVEDYSVRIGAAGGDDELVMNIIADKTTIRENETVTLSVEGAPADAVYAWTFNGAAVTSSAEAQPVISYVMAGAYDIEVVVTLPGGNARTLRENRFVVVSLAKLSADFSADKTLSVVGEKVNFASTSVATGNIQSLEWVFDGGEPAVSTVEKPVVTYTAPGKYAVKLTITDEYGKTDTKTMAGMIEVKEMVKADFEADKTRAAVGETVQFTNLSVAAANIQWTFDGGEPAQSTDQNPSVKFSVAGASMATLVATDADGKRDVKSVVITVTPVTFGAIRLEGLSQAYNGEEKLVSVTTTPAFLAGDVQVSYMQNGNKVTPKDAGVYDVVAKYAGSVPYSVKDVVTTMEITKAKVQVVGSDLRLVYNGQPQVPVFKTIPTGFEEFISVEYFHDGAKVEVMENAGEYPFTAQVSGTNYESEPLKDVFVIKKKAGKVSVELEKKYTYDGLGKTVRSVTTEPAGMQTEILYNGLKDAPVNGGRHSVVVNIKDDNYEGRVDEELIIKPGTCGVRLVQSRFEYNGKSQQVMVETTPGGIPYELTFKKDDVIVGDVVAVGVYQAVMRINTDDYETVVSQEFNVIPAPAQVKISNLRYVYDGQTKAVKVETVPADLPVIVTYNGFSQLPYAVGEYSVLVEAANAEFHGYKTATMVIVPAEESLKVMDLVVVDGTKDCIFRVPELKGLNKSLIIFDASGGQVYESKEYFDDYDMRDLPAGTYYYIMTYVEEGQKKDIKGFVEVIRK